MLIRHLCLFVRLLFVVYVDCVVLARCLGSIVAWLVMGVEYVGLHWFGWLLCFWLFA